MESIKENEFIELTVQKVIKELDEDIKKEISLKETENDLIFLHFGFGMYIRNTYIYGKYESEYGFYDADAISSKIIKKVWLKLKQDAKS